MVKIKLKLKKKTIIIILITILVIGLGVGSYFLFFNKDNKKTKKVQPTPVAEKKVQIVDEDSTSRPFAVMINNINVARP